jgi:hypothetical protein
MAPEALVLDDCGIARCDLPSKELLQFIPGQRPSGYVPGTSEHRHWRRRLVWGACVVQYGEQASPRAGRMKDGRARLPRCRGLLAGLLNRSQTSVPYDDTDSCGLDPVPAVCTRLALQFASTTQWTSMEKERV